MTAVTHSTAADSTFSNSGRTAWDAAHTIDPDLTWNLQTGTTYTLQASDNGGGVRLTNGSAITLTVPSGLGAGFNCLIAQYGAGQVTVSGSGATVNSRGGATKLNGQYAVGSLMAHEADVFLLAGDVTT